MKTCILWAFALLVSSAASAGLQVEEGSDGTLRASNEAVVWKRTTVVVEPEVLHYGELWKTAYKKPGTVVSLARKNDQVVRMVGMTTAKVATVVRNGIIRTEGVQPKVMMVTDYVMKEEVQWSSFYIAWGLAFLTMIFYTWHIARDRPVGKHNLPLMLLGLAVVLVIFGTFLTSVLHSTEAAALMMISFVAIGVGMVAHPGKRSARLVLAGAYFVSAIAHLAVVTVL